MNDKEKADFLATARKRASKAMDAWSTNFDLMDVDADFIAGGDRQWPEQVRRDRDATNRPYLTFNKLPSIVDQIVGDQRQMRPAITVFPAQGNVSSANQKVKSLAGTNDYSLAEVYQGIIKNIEYCSQADIAYDTAFEHCVSWGLGWFRICTDYEDDDSFDQEFEIKRVRNYKAVLADPDFEDPDGSDMEWCLIFSKMTKESFEAKYPGKEAVSVNDYDDDAFELWADGEYVFVAEYYYIKEVEKTIYQMSNGAVYDSDVEPVLDELAASGITVVKSRKVKSDQCYWAKISGKDILEEEQPTVFEHIPVIPVMGKELVVEGTPVYRGAVRHALDAQRMYNYSRTADIERTALIPKVPYVISDKQIRGFENDWAQANSSNKPFLVYKESGGAPPPMRQPPVSTNPGETSQSMQASDDIKATTGMFDPSLGNYSQATSGRQELILQSKGDRGNFAFSDNLVRSIRHAGRILIKAIPKVYDTNRIIRLRFPDESEDFVEINKTIYDEQTGEEIKVHDLGAGEFDLIVKPGPSYATQRMQAADTITQFIQALGGTNPSAAAALTMLAAKNMDWPESDEVVKIIKKTLPPGLIDPDPNEPPPPPTQPDPYAVLDAQTKQAKAQGDMATAQARIKEAEAREKEAEAKTLEILDRLQNLEQNQRQIVTEAVTQIMNDLLMGGTDLPTNYGQ